MLRLATTVCLICASTAHAQDAFNTFLGAFSNFYYQLRNYPGFPRDLGWRFTAQESGEITAVHLGASRIGSNAAPVTLDIYNVSGSEVGALLGQIPVVVNTSASPVVPAFYPTPGSGINLTAGTEYYFVVGVDNPEQSIRWWIYGDRQFSGQQAHIEVPSSVWTYQPNLSYPGFSITVPAPSAAATLFSVAAVTLQRRRRA